MSVLDTTTTPTVVPAEAAELLTSGRIRVYLSATAGQSPQVAATILPERDGVRRRAWGVSLKYGVWDCDAHHSSTCACCLAVQANTTGPAPAVCCAHDPADHDALGCTARVGFPGMPTTSCDCLTPAPVRTAQRTAGL
ncbi:hypothetical protein MXD62_23000 [Frankia sp. Mgl5]|uniref:hypothetical protein n=1 Tax=Frankia sp. Mgl5 TaxID=2933793 RepID=UPI00200C5B81|nr:hypothetical protein [Frankia sp. Mgl5]MCK9929998.1 hypothetical protein [Frankia sp. Mgl5]